ncbi:MAG TPA: hypothetical protein VFR90_14680 [Methylibium sp.]|uniref:hypothetical protein n=1 Tax=Methylibium sp. TaxID=2067992 RepID=UPI002DB5BDCC|nr:hypothetical protein [Methylibium sp.]HEU4460363.1 hypothetical protein [Methylibium sp.]
MNTPASMLTPARATLVACAVLVAACATPTASGPGAPPVSEAPVAAGAGGLFGSGLSEALEPQRARLAQLLRGTPVAVEATAERALRIAVPLKNSFEPGRSAVRPALAAVLDQVATGFKPYAATSELRIATPDDPNARVAGRLPKERSASVRDYLVARGVPVSRMPVLAATSGDAGVELLVVDRPLNAK